MVKWCTDKYGWTMCNSSSESKLLTLLGVGGAGAAEAAGDPAG